jgi:hypothetical protein
MDEGFHVEGKLDMELNKLEPEYGPRVANPLERR